ncbi:hypothetical protein HON71_01735 [Candidatus Woesearchaeota archaeon]|nr:hypothetical protein [Candidatus Woesearchaeota archaeon]MBT5342420.1 hypothetical protein [Candidatus Woesearchaeota archaeon]
MKDYWKMNLENSRRLKAEIEKDKFEPITLLSSLPEPINIASSPEPINYFKETERWKPEVDKFEPITLSSLPEPINYFKESERWKPEVDKFEPITPKTIDYLAESERWKPEVDKFEPITLTPSPEPINYFKETERWKPEVDKFEPITLTPSPEPIKYLEEKIWENYSSPFEKINAECRAYLSAISSGSAIGSSEYQKKFNSTMYSEGFTNKLTDKHGKIISGSEIMRIGELYLEAERESFGSFKDVHEIYQEKLRLNTEWVKKFP